MNSVPRLFFLLCLCSILIATASPQDSLAEETRIERGRSLLIKPAKPADTKRATTESKPSKKNSTTISRTSELAEILNVARTAQTRISKEIDDYTCTLYRREYVNGKVTSWQAISVKIRHEKKENGVSTVPFSVYLHFLKPKGVKGREVLYVQNRDNGDLIGRRGGRRNPNMTLQLEPSGPLAMEGNRYPITEIGFQNLSKRLVEVLEQEKKYNDGVVEVFENAKVGDRKCIHYRITHDKRRPNLTYHMAEASVDDELGIPIRYGAYDFPKEEGGKPQLLEQYVYANIHINVGLTDKDFDPRNPAYHFQLREDIEDTPNKPSANRENSTQEGN